MIIRFHKASTMYTYYYEMVLTLLLPILLLSALIILFHALYSVNIKLLNSVFSQFSMNRQNITFWSKVGKMGIGKRVPIISDHTLCTCT